VATRLQEEDLGKGWTIRTLRLEGIPEVGTKGSRQRVLPGPAAGAMDLLWRKSRRSWAAVPRRRSTLDPRHQDMRQFPAIRTLEQGVVQPHRPNGPGERSPGLRPQADTLGWRGQMGRRPEGPRDSRSGRSDAKQISRGPSGRRRLGPARLPRVSAFGLNPGLRSPGPLGRWGQHG